VREEREATRPQGPEPLAEDRLDARDIGEDSHADDACERAVLIWHRRRVQVRNLQRGVEAGLLLTHEIQRLLADVAAEQLVADAGLPER